MKILKYTLTYVVSFTAILLILSSPSCISLPPDILCPLPDDVATSLNDKILESVCMISTDISYGSGTLIEKTLQPDDTYLCRVLTAAHVILDDDDKLTPDIYVVFFDKGENAMFYPVEAEAYDVGLDLALLKFSCKSIDAKVSKILSRTIQLSQGDHVFSAGCGKFEIPYVADGRVVKYGPVANNIYGLIIDSKDYLTICGPTIYGNSGGAVFYRLGDDYVIAGVIDKLHVAYGQPIYTLGYCIPSSEIIDWFRRLKMNHLCD
jgi:hypothetical protein